jgi:hypothetical protein
MILIDLIDFLKRFWFIIFIVISLGWCASNITIERATPENIAKWEIRKKEILARDVCYVMNMEIQSFKESGVYCSNSYNKLVSSARLLSMLDGDVASLPEEHRSLNNIFPSIDSLPCRNSTTVTEWKNCPTGNSFEFKNR